MKEVSFLLCSAADDEWTLADESPSPKLVIAAQESDPKFFNRVEEDVNKILQKEKIQEEYRKVCLLFP